MSKVKVFIQILIGFLPIFILWCVGGYFGDIMNDVDEIFYVENEEIILSCIVPFAIMWIIPFLLCLMSIISKRYNMKALYISAVVSTSLPVVSHFLSSVFSDDGNILSWIFAFTLGLPLYPFGRIAHGLYEGVSSYYFVYKDKFFEEEYFTAIYVGFLILSLIMFFIMRTKKDKIAKVTNQE